MMFKTAAALAALALGMGSAAQAATLVGLTADNTLVKIDTATLAASPATAITGTDKVIGIDVRPADGTLWGLTASGQLVTLDPTGKATAGSMLSEKVALGERPVVDFNPVADRLRVIGVIAAFKETQTDQIRDESREQQLLERIAAHARELRLDPHFVTRLFR